MNSNLKKRIISSIFLIPLSLFFIIKGADYFIFFLSIALFITIYEWYTMNKNNFIPIILGILFIFFSFYLTFLFRNNLGLINFLFVLLICISSDIGGYIFGKILNGPKLTKLSPNKTYAGVIGSFLLSLIFGLIFLEYFGEIYILDLFDLNNHRLSLILLILLISFLSQVGDLTISYFKRFNKVKDTGNIIPGHGGLLDRIDGLIFVLPILYLIL
tara:strand:+ start:12473 stop:13117 length:645 start_codon:yes stop_codon:yes gene_type:complete